MGELSKKNHLGLRLVGEYSSGVVFVCKKCKAELYTEKSNRTGWKEWLFTREGKRHYKTKCGFSSAKGGE